MLLPLAATAAALYLGHHYRAAAIVRIEEARGWDLRGIRRRRRHINLAALALTTLVVVAIWMVQP